MSFSVLLLGLAASIVGAAENDFNCPADCGKYHERDDVGVNLHRDCEAFTAGSKCRASFTKEAEKKKKRKKKKKHGGTRIVGGFTPEWPMPWMVMLKFDSGLCGGSLVNSQFVLTAAHCPCGGAGMCTRFIGDVKKGVPIRMKKGQLGKVKAFIGATCPGNKNCGKAPGAREIFSRKPSGITFSVKKMFIHPLLSTQEELRFTPDILLVMLTKKVTKWSSSVRPICLATPHLTQKPLCSDNSRDRAPTKQEVRDDLVPRGSSKILGGCGTVAGWGHRFSEMDHENEDSPCMTDHSSMAPDKISLCQGFWTLGDDEYENCTTDDIPVSALAKPCKFFAQELSFQKALDEKLGTKKSRSRYLQLDLDQLVTKQKSPIEIVFTRRGKTHIIHCGKMDFEEERKNKKWPGWCATKLDRKENIEKWGYCSSACTDTRDTFMFANMNLLTDEECRQLFDEAIERGEKEGTNNDLQLNLEYELCAGKKHNFPKDIMSFTRKTKRKSKGEEENEKAKKLGLPSKYKSTRYRYKMNKKYTKVSLGTGENYKYDWFLGGSDTCQGDSGGPLWRNVKAQDKSVRATQLGVVSRGKGCAFFNFPAIYGSVQKAFSWIKETIESEMGGQGYCA